MTSINKIFNSLLFQFLLGGTLVSGITYLANNVSARAAAILVAFPIGLIPLFFLKDRNKERKLSFDTTITNVLVVLTYITLDILLRQENILSKYGVTFSMLFWVVAGLFIYHFAGEVGIK